MEEMKQEKFKVYIKINEDNNIIEINSSKFLSDTTDWIEIDEGFGDKFCHAQCNYLSKPISEFGKGWNYKYINNKIVEQIN